MKQISNQRVIGLEEAARDLFPRTRATTRTAARNTIHGSIQCSGALSLFQMPPSSLACAHIKIRF